MKQLIIIGAGGYGREVCNMAPECHGYGKTFVIKGFLDDTENPLGPYPGYPPVLARILDYVPQPEDVFVCAISDIAGRKKCTELIASRGGEFMTLLHLSSAVQKNSIVGKGCIINACSWISCDSIIGDHVHFQANCNVGHDARIGAWSFLHYGTFIGGRACLGEGVHVYPYAIIHPRRKIGDYATIGAGSFVLRDVQAQTTVYGNPAKTL